MIDKTHIIHALEALGTGGVLKVGYDVLSKFLDGKAAKKKLLMEAKTASVKLETDAEVAREKVHAEAETAKEKRLDETALGLIDRLQSMVETNQEHIAVNETRFQAQIDGLHSRLDEETEKRRLSEIFREAAELRAQTAEEALRRLNSQHSLLELELIVAKREVSEANATTSIHETTISSLESRLHECEAKIYLVEKFCRERNIVLPDFYAVATA